MDTKQITVTLTLPKKFESLHALEMAIHAEGQRIKQQLFETELQAVIDEEKQNVSLKPLACPDCGSNFRLGNCTLLENLLTEGQCRFCAASMNTFPTFSDKIARQFGMVDN